MALNLGGRAKTVLSRYRRERGYLAMKVGCSKKSGAYKTANSERIETYGKEFVETFPKITLKGKKRRAFVVDTGHSCLESRKSVRLAVYNAEAGKVKGIPADVAFLKLGFSKNAAIVEAIQGTAGWQPEFERFRALHGKPWANYLVEKLEEQARRTGFRQVKIRAPESLFWYYHKSKDESNSDYLERRKRMEALYNNVANAMGYSRKGNFFVKGL